MTKTTAKLAANARRENSKADKNASAINAATSARNAQQAIETGAYNFAKGAGELLASIKAGIAARIAEHLLRDAALRGAMIYRLGKVMPEDANDRAKLMAEADAILKLSRPPEDASKATDAHRSADQQRAYDTAKKIWQRAYKDAKGEPKAKRKAKPQAKASAKSGDTVSPGMAKPLDFAEYVKRPPVLKKPADAIQQARNLAALMSAELKQSAKALPGDVRAMYAAFINAAKSLEDVSK